MRRSWVVWLSLLLLAVSVGWFWLLSHDLGFTRSDQPEPKPPVEAKVETRKGK